MKTIPLTQGKYALVADEDFDWLNQWKWVYHNQGYAVRSGQRKNGKRQQIRMHRIVIANWLRTTPLGFNFVDHINHNGLDNRRKNLRICNYSTNAQNKKKSIIPMSSKYKGVHKTPNNTWRANIYINGKRITIGTFLKERWAALAYDLNAKNLYGEFALTNF